MRAGTCMILFALVCVLGMRRALAQGEDFLGKVPPPFVAREWLNVKGGKPPDIQGKVVLYEFWTTWCGVCKRAIPRMIEIDQKFRKKGLVFISMTYEEKPVVEKFLKTSKITYPVALDRGDKETFTAYGIRGVPTAYIVGPNGRVLWNGQPEALIDAQIEELIHEGFRAGEFEAELAKHKLPTLTFDKVGEGPAIVLIHGLGGSAKDWRKVVPVWSKNLTVYTVDLYGHGRTPPLKSERGKPITVADLARGVLQFLREQKIDRPILVGHSMGGLVALQLAEINPSAYAGLIIVDMPPAPKQLCTASQVAADRVALTTDTENFIRERWSQMATRPEDVEHVVSSALATDRKTFQELYLDIRATDLSGGLGKLRLPVQVVYAEPPGGFSPMNNPEKLYAEVPHLNLSIISGVRHFIMLDDPMTFTRTVLKFIAKVYQPQREPPPRSHE